MYLCSDMNPSLYENGYVLLSWYAIFGGESIIKPVDQRFGTLPVHKPVSQINGFTNSTLPVGRVSIKGRQIGDGEM